MSIKSLYPDTRPSLNLDFANTKVLDPRVTFARASTATYYDGKTTHKAEENLALYSQTFTDPYWAKFGVSITANSTTAPDGTLTASTLTATNDSYQQYLQAFTGLDISDTMTYSVYLKAGTKDNVRIYAYNNPSYYANFDLTNGVVTANGGTDSYSITNVGNGWYRCSITGTKTHDSQYKLVIYGQNGNFYIWGAQFEQRSSLTAYTPTTSSPITRYAPTLLTAPTNSPRFDHNPTTGESLGLLIEEQRTNLWLQSSNLTASDSPVYANWNFASTFANAAIAPDGTLTADTFYGSAPTASIVTRFSATAGVTYTFSIYLKKDPTSNNANLNYFGFIVCWSNNGTTLTGYDFPDLVSGQNTSDVLTNEWKRFSVSYTCPSGATSMEFGISNRGFGLGSQNYSVLCWGAQIESGPFPTSYTPTTGSQVTRSADSASMTGTNFSSWYTEGEGTLYAEQIVGNIDAARSNQTAALLYLNTSNLIGIGQAVGWGGTSGSLANMWIHSNNSIQMINGTANFLNVGDTLKSAGAYTFNDAAFSGNTQPLLTDNTVIVPTGLNQLLIGNGYPGYYSNGWIKKISYYPKRLPNSQLQALTQP
jgi:hypothetical protein